jgi:DNA invertase Pin-like site-specific DNA recombinase
MTWIGYSRCSTGKQADSGLGLLAQRTKLEAWATFHGRELVIIEDAGVSGSTLNRPGWRRVERALAGEVLHLQGAEAQLDPFGLASESWERAPVIEGVVVVKLDRITRSVRDLLALVDEYFTGDDAPGFVSCSEAIDTTTPMGRFVLTIFGALGQLEREMISERTSDAMQEAKRQGRIVGPVPVGRRDRGDGFHEDDPDQFACWLFVGDIDSFTEAASVANEGGLRRAGGSPWDRKSIKRLFDTAEKYGWER